MVYDLDRLTRGVQDPAVRAALLRMAEIIKDMDSRISESDLAMILALS
jgi:hypothetical protein